MREQLNAFVTQESLALQQMNYFVSEQLLGSDGIDVGDRQPLTLIIPKPTRGKSMQVRMWLDETSKGLRYGHDTGAGFAVAGGLEHQLLDGFVCESSELSHWKEDPSGKQFTTQFDHDVFRPPPHDSRGNIGLTGRAPAELHWRRPELMESAADRFNELAAEAFEPDDFELPGQEQGETATPAAAP